MIKPWGYEDPETGDKVAVSVSPHYSKLTINDREYYFIRETGEFDGTATVLSVRPETLRVGRVG